MKALLALLGAQTEAEAIETVHALNQFISDTRAATGAEDRDGALNAVQLGNSIARQLESVTGKTGQEAVNQVTAWKKEAENSNKLAKQVVDLEADKAKTELNAHIAKLSSEGKLPPSLHDWARSKSSKEELDRDVEAWGATQQLATGSPAVEAGTTTGASPASATAGSNGEATLTAEELEVCQKTGTDPAQFLERKKFEGTAPDRQAVNISAGGNAA